MGNDDDGQDISGRFCVYHSDSPGRKKPSSKPTTPDIVSSGGTEMVRAPAGTMVPTNGDVCPPGYDGPATTDFKCHRR